MTLDEIKNELVAKAQRLGPREALPLGYTRPVSALLFLAYVEQMWIEADAAIKRVPAADLAEAQRRLARDGHSPDELVGPTPSHVINMDGVDYPCFGMMFPHVETVLLRYLRHMALGIGP